MLVRDPVSPGIPSSQQAWVGSPSHAHHHTYAHSLIHSHTHTKHSSPVYGHLPAHLLILGCQHRPPAICGYRGEQLQRQQAREHRSALRRTEEMDRPRPQDLSPQTHQETHPSWWVWFHRFSTHTLTLTQAHSQTHTHTCTTHPHAIVLAEHNRFRLFLYKVVIHRIYTHFSTAMIILQSFCFCLPVRLYRTCRHIVHSTV